jgi:hypothetical protein
MQFPKEEEPKSLTIKTSVLGQVVVVWMRVVIGG